MTLVVHQNVYGIPRGQPITLPSRRRRLSTIARRHGPVDRRFIVSVHRRGEPALIPTDPTVRLCKSWAKTLVGPQDVVLITVVPLGGGGASGGKGKSALGIGLALASVALMALAGPVGGALVGTLGATGAFAVQAGMVVGGLALSFAAQMANANKKKDKTQEVFSVSGGGNIPKPGQRKPLKYGRHWSAPPLSQADFTLYTTPTSMVLIKRMTLGLGEFQIHAIRVGDATFWTEAGGILPPFNMAGSEAGLEFLYEQPSTIAPGDVISSGDVSGQTLPRTGGNPEWTPWFKVAPVGTEIDKVQLDMQFPAGLIFNSSSGQKAALGQINFQIRRLSLQTGEPISGESAFYNHPRQARTTMALRHTEIIQVARGSYEVRAQNGHPDPGQEYENRAAWDALRGWIDDVRIRPKTTEVVIKIPAGEGLTVTSFSDVMVEATRKVPVWDGSAWLAPQATRKAVWAFCDLVRNEYGLNQPTGVDVASARHYAELFDENDTYDGELPEVSSFWEAGAEILQPFRADPVKLGAVHSFVRDESQDAKRHVISRRQIVEDTAQETFVFVEGEGDGGDVIVEFDHGGDPKRPGEVRWSLGPPTRTPKRYRIPGVTSGTHARALATWLAVIAVFRGAKRTVTTEWDGRLIYPGSRILCDFWFLKGKQAYGVWGRDGNTLFTNTNLLPLPANPYVSMRGRDGREWGLLRVTTDGPRRLVLNGDDVAGVTAQTGKSLSAVLARDTQDSTTVVVGELLELQETYVARSAIPADEDHVTIEMVLDDTRVWQILGETVHVPEPPFVSTEDPLIPTIEVLHARCERIETNIEVIWSISPPRGAKQYEVWLSYDAFGFNPNPSWELLSSGPLYSGRNGVHQSDDPITIRARAFGRTGLAGDWTYVTFVTQSPVVDGGLLEPLSVTIEKLQAQVRKDLAAISAIGRETIDGAFTQARGTIRDELRKLDSKLEELAGEAASEAGESYTRREFIKIQVRGAFAAVERETKLRASEDAVLASITTSLGVRLTTAEGTLTGQAVVIQGLEASVTYINGTLTAQASFNTSIASRIDLAELSLSGQATATQALTTRVTATEGNITATAQALTALDAAVSVQGGQIAGNTAGVQSLFGSVGYHAGVLEAHGQALTGIQSTITTQGGQIAGQATAVSDMQTTVTYLNGQVSVNASATTALQSTVGSHTTTLTQHASSIDGVRGLYGVTIEVDGTIASGFRLTGFRRNDGVVTGSFGIYGDLVVDGTITGSKLQAYNIIAYTAQIGALTVDTLAIKDGAVSNSNAARSNVGAGETTANVALNTRANARVSVIGMFDGAPGSFIPTSVNPGRLRLFRDGGLIADVGTSYAVVPGSGTNYIFLLPTPVMAIDLPPAGAHVYSIATTNGLGSAGGAVTIVLNELAK